VVERDVLRICPAGPRAGPSSNDGSCRSRRRPNGAAGAEPAFPSRVVNRVSTGGTRPAAEVRWSVERIFRPMLGSMDDDVVSRNDAVIVRFEFAKREFEAAMRTMLLRLTGHRLVIAVGGALIAVGAWFLVVDGDDHAFITPGLMLLGYVALALFFMPKWRWRSAKAVHGEQLYTFDPHGMVFKTPVSESRLSWGYFPKLVESRGFYFFRSRGRVCNPIPKHAFADADQEAQFRTVVGQHIDTKLRAVTGP